MAVPQREEDTMLLRIYSIGVIVFDILVLLLKCTYALLESLFYSIIPPAEKSVVGEIVLITGTGHGIGRELALKFASLGATIVAVDINEKGNQETVQLVNEMGYKKIHPYRCDVANREEVNALIEKVNKEVAPVTILVNNAGIMPCHPFLETTPEEITKMFEINVFAHFWLLQAVLPKMISSNHGHIVALSSMAGIAGVPNVVPYCGTKFAVRGFMEALAEELRLSGKCPDVQFTCIFPYIVDTGLCKNPRIKFPGLMPKVSPQDAASSIVTAVRRNTLLLSLPSHLLHVNNYFRLYPPSVARHVKDFIDAGVDPH